MIGVTRDARKFVRPPAILLLILLGCGALCSAQLSSSNSNDAKKDYALIFGTVWGPDSHPVAGIPIRIRVASEKKFRWELVSNRTGEFAQRVPVGKQDYVIQANIKTARGVPKPEITVHIDDNERKDVGVHLTQEDLARH